MPSGCSTTAIVPPCSWTTQRAMARPRPVPPPEARAPRVNRSKTRSRSACGMPGPSSATSISTWSPSRRPMTRDRPAGGAVPGGVVEQVGQDLVQPRPVGADQAFVRDGAGQVVDLAAGRGRLDLGLGDHLVEEVLDVGTSSRSSGTTPASRRDRSSSSVTSRPSRSVWARAVRSVAGSGSDDAVDDVLQHRLQRGDRRAQLVRDVGDQLAALLVGRGQVGGHLVERDGQLARPRRARWPGPGRV